MPNTGNVSHKRRIGPQLDTRELLLTAGVGQYTAAMSQQYMFFLPRTSDPYAQGVMQIIQGLQRLYNERGARLQIDGGLGEKTVSEISKISGPRWYDKSWAQLMGDAIAGDAWAGFGRKGRMPQEPLSDFDYVTPPGPLGQSFIGDLVSSPVPWMAAAAFVWWKWFR
jgi:hypothetical protein